MKGACGPADGPCAVLTKDLLQPCSSDARAIAVIEIGSLDRVTSVIGERGTGKSTWAMLDARVFQRETGGFVIAHSPRGQVGRAPDIMMHNTIKRAARSLRWNPGVIHVVTDDSPEDVLDYARDLAFASRKRAHRDANVRWYDNRPAPKGLRAPPVLAVIDEGTALRRGMSNSEIEDLQRFLTSARHEHVAVTMLSQAPNARSWTFQEQSSRFRIFRYLHEWGLNAIRAAAVPQEHLQRIRDLPKFSYFRLDKDVPLRARFEVLPGKK